MSPAAEARLLAVWDCGVIRAPINDPGLLELCQRAMVTRSFVSRGAILLEERYDYRITERGRREVPHIRRYNRAGVGRFIPWIPPQQ